MCDTRLVAQTKVDRLIDVLDRLIEKLSVLTAEQKPTSGIQNASGAQKG